MSAPKKPRAAVHEARTTLETWSHALDLRALAAAYGTPLYVIHEPTLRDNFARYLRLVDHPERIRYPVKANPSTEVLEIIAALGGGADCASRDEVWAALDAGIPIRAISYGSPAPDIELAEWLLRSGATVVADSLDLLTDLTGRLTASEMAGRLFVRVNPGGLPGYKRAASIHRYTAHGAASSPFGIPSETLVQALVDYPLPVTGLHMHVGTQMDNLEAFEVGIDFLHRLRDAIENYTPHRIGTVNLGGGLGIPFLDGQSFPTIDALADALVPLRREDLNYEVEPGNSLVGDAVALLARVVALKAMRGRRWGIIDVGTDQLVKFTVARWEHQIVDAEHRPLPTEGPDALVGPLCFAGDVLLPATRLDGVRRGDPVLIRHAGAYCESVSSRFNGRRGPAHVLIGGDGSVRLSRRAEDTFFQPAVQAHVPPSFARAAAAEERAAGTAVESGLEERLDARTVSALQSEYMHALAAEEGYTIVEARRVGERAYQFEIEPHAAVDFVAMPLALRIAGDACIIAVGHVLGWRAKAGPVWATRLTLTCGATLPSSGRFPCRVAVGAPRPGAGPEGAHVFIVHFELGSGEVVGTARVVVPVHGGGPITGPAPGKGAASGAAE